MKIRLILFVMSFFPVFTFAGHTSSPMTLCKRDMRNMLVAIEGYRIEEGAYPIALAGEQFPDSTITTPVSYLTSVPKDFFAKPKQVRLTIFLKYMFESGYIAAPIVCFFVLIITILVGRKKQFEASKYVYGLVATIFILWLISLPGSYERAIFKYQYSNEGKSGFYYMNMGENGWVLQSVGPDGDRDIESLEALRRKFIYANSSVRL